MARYNHFLKPTHERVHFSDLCVGDEFSFKDKPFEKVFKVSKLQYKILKTKQNKMLFNDNNLLVYIRS